MIKTISAILTTIQKKITVQNRAVILWIMALKKIKQTTS